MDEQSHYPNLFMASYNNDTKTVREILFTNLKFFNRPDSIEFVELNIFVKTNFEKATTEPFINFLEMGMNGNLERQLKIAIIRGNLQQAELLLKNGAKLERPEWDRNSVSRFVFCGINADTRKEMLFLLFKYGLDPTVRSRSNWNLLHMLLAYSPEDYVDDTIEIAKIL